MSGEYHDDPEIDAAMRETLEYLKSLTPEELLKALQDRDPGPIAMALQDIADCMPLPEPNNAD